MAAAGGVIGVCTQLAASALEYAQNIQALVEVADIGHVCLGPDTKLTPPYRPASAPTKYGPTAGRLLLRRGRGSAKDKLHPKEIGKVGGSNFCLVFGIAMAGHR